MSGFNYSLHVNGTDGNNITVNVTNQAAAYEHLENSVLKRACNFGELRIGKDNQLEIINNHKNAVINAIFHRNTTITTEQENRNVRQAVYDILANKFRGSAVLKEVEKFLCGDKVISKQPLTRDEVANMIKLLSTETKDRSKVVEFLRTSYGLKHGLVDSAIDVKLRDFSTAKENRVSANVAQARQSASNQEKAALLKEVNKNMNNEDVIRKVWKCVLSSPTQLSTKHMFASLGNPEKLTDSRSVKDFFMEVVAKYIKGVISSTPEGWKFLGDMMNLREMSIVKKLGGDSCAVNYAKGEHDLVRMQMQMQAISDLDKNQDWRNLLENNYYCDEQGLKVNPGLKVNVRALTDLDEYATLNEKLSEMMPGKEYEAGIRARSFGSRLRGGFLRASVILNEGVEVRKTALRDFVELFKLNYHAHVNLDFSKKWSAAMTRLSMAFSTSGGDVKSVETGLASLKEVLKDELKLMNKDLEFANVGTMSNAEKGNFLNRGDMLVDAAAVISFIEELLKGDSQKEGMPRTHKNLTSIMTFLSADLYIGAQGIGAQGQIDEEKSFDENQTDFVKSWLTDTQLTCGKDIEDFCLNRLKDKIEAFKNAQGNGNKKAALQELMDACEAELNSFCVKHLKTNANFFGSSSDQADPFKRAVFLGLQKALQCGALSVDDETGVIKKMKQECMDKMQTFFKMEKGTGKAKDLLNFQAAHERLGGLSETLFGRQLTYEQESIDMKIEWSIREKRRDELENAQQAVIDEFRKPPFNDNQLADSIMLVVKATKRAAGDESSLPHVMVKMGDVIGAFNGPEALEKNKKLLSFVSAACQKTFGLTSREIGLFIDPVAVAILGETNGADESSLVAKTMQCILYKARTVCSDANADPETKKAAKSLLLKQYHNVHLAKSKLAPLRRLLKAHNLAVADNRIDNNNRPFDINAVRRADDRLGTEALMETILNAFGKLSINLSHETTYKEDAKVLGLFTVKRDRKVELEIKTPEQLKLAHYQKFWDELAGFFKMLDPINYTLTQSCNLREFVPKMYLDMEEDANKGKPENQKTVDALDLAFHTRVPEDLDPLDQAFCAKVRTRFDFANAIVEGNEVNEVEFKKLVGAQGQMRHDYSLSFNFD